MLLRVITATTLALSSSPVACQHNEFERVLARFEARLATDVAEDGLGAITAAVCIGDDVRWTKGFGWADRSRPATADTIYRVGSISKSLTGVLLAILWEKGIVGLDDPVVQHLPEFAQIVAPKEQAQAITLRQLASHTSGLMREPIWRDAARGPIAQWEQKVLDSIPKTPTRTPPGQRYSYSNIGHGILGLTLGRAARKPFMKQVHDCIFAPVGMRSSTFILNAEQKRRLARGYLRRDGKVSSELPELEHAGRGYKVPNGGVYSTAPDLCRFIAALSGTAKNPLFREKTRREILRRQTPEGDPSAYALGFSLGSRDGLSTAGHGGSVAGYNAYLIFDQKSKIGVALLRNYNRGATSLGRAATKLLTELVVAQK